MISLLARVIPAGIRTSRQISITYIQQFLHTGILELRMIMTGRKELGVIAGHGLKPKTCEEGSLKTFVEHADFHYCMLDQKVARTPRGCQCSIQVRSRCELKYETEDVALQRLKGKPDSGLVRNLERECSQHSEKRPLSRL